MRYLIRIYLLISLVVFVFSVTVHAQASKDLGLRYSRWAVEVDIATPVVIGTLTSLPADGVHLGVMFGAGVVYQWNRAWGFGVSFNRGQNRLGARGYAADYLLGEDGMTYYLPQSYYDNQGLKTFYYKDIYSDVSFISGRIHAEINVVNLLGSSSADKWCSVLLMPGISVNRFSASVKSKVDDWEILPGRTCMNLGFGGDLALRFRLSRVFDLQLKSGVMWMSDNDFVGFKTAVLARYNYMWNTSFGIIFKVPQHGKRANVMYAPRNGECYCL